MKHSSPSNIKWIIGLIPCITGIIGDFVKMDFLSAIDYFILPAGFVLLVTGTMLR
jgi:hypothetical protein